jgi:hypothetical protein
MWFGLRFFWCLYVVLVVVVVLLCSIVLVCACDGASVRVADEVINCGVKFFWVTKSRCV